MGHAGRAIAGIALGAMLLSGAVLFAQGDVVRPEAGQLADDLRRAAFRLADRSMQDLMDSRNNVPGDVQEAVLAHQIDAGATLLADMIRRRRPVAEVREVASVVSELSRNAPATSRYAGLWRSVHGPVAELNRILGIRPPVVEVPPAERPIVGRLAWRGSVDDRVHLVIRRMSVEVQTLSGQPASEGVASFTAALPASPVQVAVTKVRGRGTARVVQQPSPLNDYTAAIEIYDSRAGAQDYQLDIFWR